jgi:uncharacterized membrane protein SirB2
MKESQTLSRWLIKARANAKGWRTAMFVFLILLVILNIFILPHHPHVEEEKIPGFWAAFGFFGAVIMAFVLKKLVFPVISRKEEFYERD